jgi:predicted GIY-YIG superfamily endonuclease
MARTSGGGRGSARGSYRSGLKGAGGRSQRNGGSNGFSSRTKGTKRSGPATGRGDSRNSGTSKNVVAYSVYDSNGKRTYIGSTNNPGRRASEHAKSGKLKRGGSLVVESGPMTRGAAQRLETKKLAGYRSRTGRLPKGNKAPDGQFRLF